MVVTVAPVFDHAPDLIERGEHEPVQYVGAERAIEALDIGVLGRLSGLDVDQIDAVALGPLLQCLADELRAIVQTQPPGCATHLDEFVQGANDAGRWQAAVDLDLHRFPVEVVVDVEGANRRPDHSASDMKAADQVWLAAGGTSSGSLIRSGRHRLPRRGKSSFSARTLKYTQRPVTLGDGVVIQRYLRLEDARHSLLELPSTPCFSVERAIAIAPPDPVFMDSYRRRGSYTAEGSGMSVGYSADGPSGKCVTAMEIASTRP